MARNDIKVIRGGTSNYRRKIRTEANITITLAPGDVIKRGGTGSNYGVIVADGDPSMSAGIGAVILFGVTATDNTATASVDGKIEYFTAVPVLSVFRGKANTAGNVDTDAELLGIERDWVTFDRSAATAAGVLTIDENEGSDVDARGLQILGGDIINGTLDITVNSIVTESGPNVSGV